MKKILHLVLYLISINSIFAQPVENLFITTEQGTKSVSAWQREGILYVPIAEFAKTLSINYYENVETGKVELKSNYFLLKTTPRSPYIIITSRSSGSSQSLSTSYINIL